jgi:hypothetical protein
MPEVDGHHLLAPGERQWRASLTLAWPLALAGAPFLLTLGHVPLCAFRQLSGQPCPLCGGTHACAALVEGNFAQAWAANPGLMPLLAIAAVHSAQLAYEAWRGRRMVRWRVPTSAWQAGGVFLLGAWVLRLLGHM